VDAAFGLGIDALVRGLGSTPPMHRDADFAGDP